MRKIIFSLGILYIILTFFALITHTVSMQHYVPIEKGRIDLTETPYEAINSIPLQGEWEFYPQALYDSSDLQQISSPEDLGGGYIKVPSEWHTYTDEMSRLGVGTYRILIKVPEPGYYALELKSIYTSFRVIVNGEDVITVGTIGKDKESSHPQFLPTTVMFYSKESLCDIIIQVGNFYHRKGGLVQKIAFGRPSTINRIFLTENGFSAYLSGILFLMGLFMLTFFGKTNKDESILYFGLFCLVISLRTLLTNTIPLLQIFPHLPFWLEMKIEYLTISFGLMLFALYSQKAFPLAIHLVVTRIVVVISILYSLLIITTPLLIYNYILNPFNTVITIYAAYWLVIMVKAWFTKNYRAVTIILGGFVLAMSVLNEIHFYEHPEVSTFFTFNLIPFGLFFFVLTHSFEFSFRYIEALNISKELTEELEQKVKDRTQQLNEANNRLLKMATTDELTELWNRNELQRRAEEETQRYNRYNSNHSSSFSVLYMDLDNFKYYNDTYSHEIGDMVLKEFACNLKKFCRRTDSIFRLGGDEFAMFLPKTDKTGAERTASRILESMPDMNIRIQQHIRKKSNTPAVIPEQHYITCSIGIAVHNDGEINIDNLIRHADEALLAAKVQGKNRFVSKTIN